MSTRVRPQPVMSVAPITLKGAPDRGAELQVKVSAPVNGDDLSIIIFSHGNGQSFHGYGPLANHWAAQGFVVLQPTHLDARLLGLSEHDPRRSQLWRFREQDLLDVLDQIALVETSVPALRERLSTRIAVAGHSWGGQTASMLLGATHPDPDDGSLVSRKDDRVTAGVLLAVPGRGGDDLSPFARRTFPFMDPDFSKMSPLTLVVAGDRDQGHLTTRGPDWWRDAYDLSPGPKALLTLFGGEHSLGGIPGYEARETTDERPERLSLVQQTTTEFLLSALGQTREDWRQTLSPLAGSAKSEAQIEIK